ncbi:MAG TPA: PKD domain-containing protein [Myxococcales bacterium]
MPQRRVPPFCLVVLLFAAFACSDGQTTVKENIPPEAHIEGGDRDAVVGEPVSFDGSTSSDADGSVTSLAWDFGDSGTSTESVASHTYVAAGAFTVTLTATDDGGETGAAQIKVHVVAKVSNKPPLPSITGPTTLEIGQLGSFDAATSTDPDGTLVGYDWSFGDGTTTKGAQVQHAWGKPGPFDVTLIATDDKGATATARLALTVTLKSNQPPRANAGSDQTGNPGIPVLFDGSASIDPDGTIEAYEWDFGDGSAKAAGVLAAHTYAAVGAYTATLKVTDDQGGTGTGTAKVDIQALDYSGTYSVNANPATLKCSGTDASWVPTQLVLTIAGATAKADETIPSQPTFKLHYEGTWNAAAKSFHMTGTFSESLAVHYYTYDGTFTDPKTFSGTDAEVIKNSITNSVMCTLNWKVTGNR